MDELLRVENVTKFYGRKKVLDKVSFTVNRGEIFGLLGPNGAGKTTLMKILAEGISYRGGVLLSGESIEKRRFQIGYCLQDEMIYRDLSAYDNLKFYAQLLRVDRKRAKELMREFDIPNKKVEQLSGGMRKKLSVAISLLGNPESLILDEPTVGLDVETRREVWRIIKKVKSEGKSVLLSTHYMEEAEALCDRVAIINDGKIIDIGTVDELKKKSKIKSAIEVRGIFNMIPEGFVQEGSSLVFYTNKPKEDIKKVVDIVGKCGEIREVILREPTLEDVFLQLTGRRLEG
ncbi:MAG: ABC transporter ATP-binding protein [Thermoplasmata archaeon]|nr:ABC transporter ATP-binding protein [Thermoplasmata archaeon]